MKIDTETQYENIANRLFNRFYRETEKIWKKDFIDFSQWFKDNSENWSKATFRLYKNALINYINYFGTDDMIDIIKNIQRKKNLNPNKKKTSQKKKKSISQTDFINILQELKYRRSVYSDVLANWLYVGIITGLRPIEWHSSKIVRNENGIFLIVENAKYSYNRSNGKIRTINLTDLEYNDVVRIEQQVNLLSDIEEEEFKKIYEQTSFLLYKITKKIFKGKKTHPTLYSARHQFSANAKGTNLSKKEVAALMGHAVDKTATVHYGKKRFYQTNVLIKPIEREVSTVKEVSTFNGKFNKEKSNKMD